MKKCPRCAEEVQDEAKICRYCNHAFSTGSDLALKLGGAIALVLALGYGIESCSTLDPAEEAGRAEARRQITRTLDIEELVKSRLRDPASAIFQHFGGGCGLVNSKNGFGGMSGQMPFVVGANDKVVFREDGSRDFDTVWQEHCVKKLGAPPAARADS